MRVDQPGQRGPIALVDAVLGPEAPAQGLGGLQPAQQRGGVALEVDGQEHLGVAGQGEQGGGAAVLDPELDHPAGPSLGQQVQVAAHQRRGLDDDHLVGAHPDRDGGGEEGGAGDGEAVLVGPGGDAAVGRVGRASGVASDPGVRDQIRPSERAWAIQGMTSSSMSSSDVVASKPRTALAFSVEGTRC